MSNLRVDELESLATGRTILVDNIDTRVREDLANPDKGAVMVARSMIVVNSVSEMTELPNIKVGSTVQTKGYYTSGDGGGNVYEIVAAGTGTADGGSFINLTGIAGQAKGMFNGDVVDVRQFGAKGDEISDDTQAVQNAIHYCAPYEWKGSFSSTRYGNKARAPLYISKGIYRITSKILLNPRLRIYGVDGRSYDTEAHYSTFLCDFDLAGAAFDTAPYDTAGNRVVDHPLGAFDDQQYLGASFLTISGITFFTKSSASISHCLNLAGITNFMVERIKIMTFDCGIRVLYSWNSTIKECLILARQVGIESYNVWAGVIDNSYINQSNYGTPSTYVAPKCFSTKGDDTLTCGIFSQYASWRCTNLVTEQWGYAYRLRYAEGLVIENAYVEAGTCLIHSHSTQLKAHFNFVDSGVGRLFDGSDSYVYLDLKGARRGVTSFSEPAQDNCEIELDIRGSFHKIKDLINVNYVLPKQVVVYVDGTYGSDFLNGYSEAAPVKSISAAMHRCVGTSNTIKVIRNCTTVRYFSGNGGQNSYDTPVENKVITIESSDSTMKTILIGGTSPSFSLPIVMSTTNLVFDNITVEGLFANYTGASNQGLVLFQPTGVCSITLQNNSTIVSSTKGYILGNRTGFSRVDILLDTKNTVENTRLADKVYYTICGDPDGMDSTVITSPDYEVYNSYGAAQVP